MDYSDNTKFLIADTIAFVKDKDKDQYNIILLEAEEEEDADKVFIVKGTSFYIWDAIAEGLNYSQLLEKMKELFEPFSDNEIKQVNEFIDMVMKKGFIECQN